MSGIIIAKGEVKNTEARFQFSWHANDVVTDASGAPSSQGIVVSFKQISTTPHFAWPKSRADIHLESESVTKERHRLHAQAFGSISAFKFVLDSLLAANSEHGTVVGLIVPQSEGYIVRSDTISLRLVHYPPVKHVVNFAQPHQHFSGETINVERFQLEDVFAASVGGLRFKRESYTGNNTLQSLSSSLHAELQNRLSYPWLSKKAPKRKTLVIIEGGRSGPDNGGVGETIYTAAHALGIDMVVFDNPGHWLQDPRYTTWYKEFVPFELLLQPDEEKFPDDIVKAVRALPYPVDGIVTPCDHYKAPVARAALELSLPTCSPEAYEIATDKYKTSVFEGHHAYMASSFEEAKAIVHAHKMEFPLIIKPCNGFLSEGVYRVEDLPDLEVGINSINTDRHGKEFVIEKYCEGPELDANFVLADGELLFFEASDDFPKSADANGQGEVKNFIELANVLPSKLPDTELAMLRDSLHQSLVRMEFKDGFYHLEARLENSSMEYKTQDGVFDLFDRSVPAKGAPSAWLIEINPRAPGIQESAAIKYTYGIDYFGLCLLFALDDKDRVRQLSHPFASGPQYWCEMVFIPVEQSGVFDSDDVCVELYKRRPDLAEHITDGFCFLQRGAVLSMDSGVNAWVAYFLVVSRESRVHVLELAETVRSEVRFDIVSRGTIEGQP